jgi:hypothetical protein
MNNRAALFMQAIRGPILLITIGLLFAAHQAGIISFSRTWPLIIIVIGLMKLFERMLAPPAQPGYPPPGGAGMPGPSAGGQTR